MESWQFLTGVAGSEGTAYGTFPPSRKVERGQFPTFAQRREGGFTPSGDDEGAGRRRVGRKWEDCGAGTSVGSGDRWAGLGARWIKRKSAEGSALLSVGGGVGALGDLTAQG